MSSIYVLKHKNKNKIITIIYDENYRCGKRCKHLSIHNHHHQETDGWFVRHPYCTYFLSELNYNDKGIIFMCEKCINTVGI